MTVGFHLGSNSCSRRCEIAETHLRRLSEFVAATSGRHPKSVSWMNSIMRDVYAGPTGWPLPVWGTMSSLIALRLDLLARSTITRLGSAMVSGFGGTSAAGTLRNLLIRCESASSHASSSRTTTRSRIRREGSGSQIGSTSGTHAPSLSRSRRITQCRNLAEWL